MSEIAVLLHDIRSAHNVGSVLRSADGAGVSAVYLSGYTPTPIDAYGRAQKEIAKTALGAECSVPWKYYASATTLIARLKREGWQIVGVEQDARAVDYRTFVPEAHVLFVMGNEVEGVPEKIRNRCDALVEIPMHGKKESLNVSVAAGVVLFRFSR